MSKDANVLQHKQKAAENWIWMTGIAAGLPICVGHLRCCQDNQIKLFDLSQCSFEPQENRKMKVKDACPHKSLLIKSFIFIKKEKSQPPRQKTLWKKPIMHLYGNAVIVSSGKCFHVQFHHGPAPSPPLQRKTAKLPFRTLLNHHYPMVT